MCVPLHWGVQMAPNTSRWGKTVTDWHPVQARRSTLESFHAKETRRECWATGPEEKLFLLPLQVTAPLRKHVQTMVKGLESNLMWTFIALNLHQLTDSKAQLNGNKVNNCSSNDIGRSHQRRRRDDREAMADRTLQTVKFRAFYLKEATDVALHILSGGDSSKS